MMRSMFAGVSGLRAHQTMMDVVGNNVANINTVGFKSSRVLFTEALSQVLQGGTSGTGQATGGVSPRQVGLGVNVAGINPLYTEGSTQLTGNPTDVSIQGDGFFAVKLAGETLYTRAGAFHFDEAGFLVDQAGAIVQGWMADSAGAVNTGTPVANMRVPVGQTIDPVATTQVSLRGNLSSATEVGAPGTTTAIDVIDAVGQAHRLSFTFEKTGVNAWTLTGTDADGNDLGSVALTFDPDSGQLLTPTDPPTFSFAPDGAAAMDISIDLGTAVDGDSHTTQFGSSTDIQATDQNGTAAGTLRSFAIGADGSLSGVYSNGAQKTLGVVGLANFADPTGLIAAGGGHLRESSSSGPALVGLAGVGGRGALEAGTLEMSNVELAQEFTNLILAQRGFQASSRIITTSDEMIQDLVNIKR
jgi:flagellar hook protein FlgE